MIVTPDLVEQQCIELLGDVHNEHLAALERQLGLQPETIVRLNTVDLLTDDEHNFGRDEMPAVLLSISDLADDPALVAVPGEPRTALTLTWRLEAMVLDVGRDRADAKQRVIWQALTAAECLMQRLPRRGSPVEALTLVSPLHIEVYEKAPALGRVEIAFDVVVPDSLTVTGGLPAATDDAPAAGQPGGPPAASYTPPEAWPKAGQLVVDVTRADLAPDPD